MDFHQETAFCTYSSNFLKKKGVLSPYPLQTWFFLQQANQACNGVGQWGPENFWVLCLRCATLWKGDCFLLSSPPPSQK